jgi:hypothetical protein
MSQKIFLRVAAVLSLFTCLGHTVGTFMSIPAEQTAHIQVYEAMQRPVVPMPIGPVRSYAELFLGTNVCVSLLLLLIGGSLWVLSKNPSSMRVLVILNGGALLAICGTSAAYFFPLPAICTGLGGVLAFLSLVFARS